MKTSGPHERSGNSSPAPGSDHSGALVLALLAVAAFCGWYLMVRDRPADTGPLRVVQKPLIPPTNTDTSAVFPGHKHYLVLGPTADGSDASKGQ